MPEQQQQQQQQSWFIIKNDLIEDNGNIWVYKIV